ncbi:serine/threonine-protein kinase [Labedaea rhizosphaerae]|uniref:non-specific serine/threonine protein kinase n=1 Tax=Labedaea rhizosphaerae TaxID=598644 RepID=A0A4R6SKI5_LABRH|nr:serine/threonine-protein kinase [Labedaea rhizosphaerae]TDQ04906.1 serine/threonine protein kinase [Labedaea rhizosphaerae]
MDVVGAGPIATVHSTRRPDGGHAALKVFPEPMDRFTSAAFERERSVLATLASVSAIVQVDDVQELPDGRPALVMELCEQSLGQLLDACGVLSVEDTTAVGEAVATALVAAHEAGLVHGGVTPHNVLLREDGEPVLADFGVALRRRYRQSAGPWTAPEVAGGAEPTERSDLYGLGAVLFTALTGRRPGERAELPEALGELVTRLLAVDPAERPPNARAVLSELTGAPGEAAGFDDFPEDVDHSTTKEVEDEFFAEWEGKPVAKAASSDEDVPLPARRKALGIVAALAVLIAVPVLARRQPPPELDAPPNYAGSNVGLTVHTTRRLDFVLDPPVDKGKSVVLTWHSDADLEYAVVIAGESIETKVVRVGRKASTRVPVDKVRRYCFQVQGTDGIDTFQTEPQPIRQAVCSEGQ